MTRGKMVIPWTKVGSGKGDKCLLIFWTCGKGRSHRIG